MNVAWVIAVWVESTKSSAASISGLPDESGLEAIAIFPSGFPVENENTAAPAAEGQHRTIDASITDAAVATRPALNFTNICAPISPFTPN